MELLILAVIVIVIVVSIYIANLREKVALLDNANHRLMEALTNVGEELKTITYNFANKTRENEKLTQNLNVLRDENIVLRKSLSEAPLGFPSLLEALKLYDAEYDSRIVYWLETKSHPAYNASQIVQLETRKRREAEQEALKAKLLLEYYLSLPPDAKEGIDAPTYQTAINKAIARKINENKKLAENLEVLRSENEILRKSLSEAPLGFPSLLEALKIYDAEHDSRIVYWLETKPHPAYTAAKIVENETRKRREAEQEARKAKLQLEYYLNLSPDAKEDMEASTEQAAISIETPPKDNDEDIAGRYLSREEYDKLSVTERNQLALDRFWHWNKSKRTIGRLYEQYIGWLYERDGWIVEYFGISEGFSDLGRDLICHRDMTTHIVQCKNWSKSKRIYEKHIFQLFGTTYEYTKNNPFEDVIGVFFTSTQLSGLARSFAKEFHIELHEGFELQHFPIIKCNIGREGERIYHLPFDQQYYTTRINHKDGDFYCSTVAEAEARGFRRAYRWHGSTEDF